MFAWEAQGSRIDMNIQEKKCPLWSHMLIISASGRQGHTCPCDLVASLTNGQAPGQWKTLSHKHGGRTAKGLVEEVLVAKLAGINKFNPRTYMVQRENWLLKVVFSPLHMHHSTHTSLAKINVKKMLGCIPERWCPPAWMNMYNTDLHAAAHTCIASKHK